MADVARFTDDDETDAALSGVIRIRAFRRPGRSSAVVRPRPGAVSRARLQSSAEGRALLERARQELAEVLAADGLVPLAGLRLSKGMSQADLAIASGIRQPQLSRLESGVHEDIMVATLERLAAALNVGLDEVNRALQASRAARVSGRPS